MHLGLMVYLLREVFVVPIFLFFVFIICYQQSYQHCLDLSFYLSRISRSNVIAKS